MTTATQYFDNVNQVQSDIGDIRSVTTDFGLALDGAKKILELPKKLEDQLREPAKAIDLPDSLVTVLGLAPYGIGSAIKTINRIGDEAADVINAQADAMGALDAAWSPARTAISAVKGLNTVVGTTATGFGVDNGVRLDEAQVLVDSLGNQIILETSELAMRLEAYNAAAEDWFATRDAILTPLKAAIAGFQNAVDELNNMVPDLSTLEDISDAVVAVFKPVSDAAKKLEDALCVVFTVTPAIKVPPVVVAGVVIVPGYTIPAVTVDVCKIIDDIGSAVGAVQNFVEDTINSILNSLGFDLFGALDDLKAKMLAPLQPVFDAIASLQATAQAVLDKINAAADDVQQQFDNLIAELKDMVDFGNLFETTFYGDEAPGLVDFADTIDGTEGEDGIYGLQGDDVLNGLDGSDFLFGGAGNDQLNGGNGNDESFGGDGDDRIFGQFGRDLVDGGAGNDILIGQAGADILIGGAGTDFALGGGGSDTFVFNQGSGIDVIIGFEDNIDEINLSADLVFGTPTPMQVIEARAMVFAGSTILNFGDDKLVLLGFGSPHLLADDLVIA